MAGLIGLNIGTDNVTGFRTKKPIVSTPTTPPEDFTYVPDYEPIQVEELQIPEVSGTTQDRDNDDESESRKSTYTPGMYSGDYEYNSLPFFMPGGSTLNIIGQTQLEMQKDAVENKSGITFTNPSGRPVTVHEGTLGGLVITGNRGNVPSEVYFDAYRAEQKRLSDQANMYQSPSYGEPKIDAVSPAAPVDPPPDQYTVYEPPAVNSHGLPVRDLGIRDDQDTASHVGGGGEIYYDSSHDWSQPTQTHVDPPRDDNDDNDSSGGGGGCFLTTAIVDRRGEDDDGTTLTKLRKFRDEFMGGKNSDDLVEYYSIAPVLVDTIPADHPDWDWIEKQIDLSVAAIDDNDNHKAYNIYKNMVLVLKTNWVGE
jgi:hypothetical protein